MGAGNSKPTEHVFYGETPVRFSNSLVTTLQSSSETDSTRQKALEFEVQSRVNSELQRLQTRESQLLQDLEARISEVAVPEIDLDRVKVQQQINDLKRRLEHIPKVAELDKEIEKAREEVVKCLRTNDTRPLDCYKEVEEFKNEVSRLEKEFVVKTVGREY
ncbi:hypothetical protein RUND412_007121 [Rhizina undulata]